jgi:type II restriction enzyme
VPVNLDKPHLWKADISASVDMYNDWFLKFAPEAYRSTRIKTTEDVKATLKATKNLTDVTPQLLKAHPTVLPTLRMSTCPPLAVDRLIGLAGVPDSLVKIMEGGGLPVRLNGPALDAELEKIGRIIERMADPDIFVWLERKSAPSEQELFRASTIVADRLCGSVANPIIRNAQEKRQLAAIQAWLEQRGYKHNPPGDGMKFDAMKPGTFSFRLNVPVSQEGTGKQINIPVDAVIMPKTAKAGNLPLLVEAKSAGDFTNVNKRRKEEATKMAQLRRTYGAERVRFILFLCGYFDSGYLGYEAAEGIDWVWEHRIDDLAEFGV